MLQHRLAHLEVQLVLELFAALLRAEHFVLHLLQLIGDVTLGVGNGLFADVMRGHFVEMRFGNLDEIAKHIIETHLERRNAGVFNFALLQLCDPFLAFACAAAQFVQLRAKFFAEDAALTQSQWRFIDNCACDQSHHFRQLRQLRG